MAGSNSNKFRIPTLQEMESDVMTEETNQPSKLKTNINKNKVPRPSSDSSCTSHIRPQDKDGNPPSTKADNDHKQTVLNRVQVQVQRPHGKESCPNTETTASETTGTSSANTVPSATNKAGSSNSLLVNPRQRGNPILKSVRNIAWEYANIVPDYVMGQANCALFLSLRYHQLHPNYIHERLKQLGKSYDLRVMLVQVDVKDSQHLLRELAKICILADCTLILAFSPEDAGRYLETYKIFENKPAEALMEKTEDNFMAKFTDCITRVKSVNKTDCSTLLSHFGSLANIVDASEEDLSLCPGFGPQKAQRLHSLFDEPFLRSANEDPTRAEGSTNHRNKS